MKLILKSLLLASAFVLPSAFGADTPLAQDTTASPQDAVKVHAPLSLERLQPSRQESTLYRVPKDALELVTGSNYENKFYVGWLDLNDLATLARVSWDWNALVQPMIDAAKLWRKIDVVPRVLANTSTDYDRVMLGLFNVSPADGGFDSALALAMDSRIIKNSVVHLGADYPEPQRTILLTLLNPASTVTDIQRSVARLKNLGPDYVDRAAKMYEKAAKDPRATVTDIQRSAAGLRGLGPAYYPRAAHWYERAANDPRATVTDIQCSAAGLRRLGPAYYPRAADLYEEAAKDPRATVTDIQRSAYGLENLGSAYYPRAAKLYELVIQHPGATNDEINTIFEILAKLGPEYKEKAIALWESLKMNK